MTAIEEKTVTYIQGLVLHTSLRTISQYTQGETAEGGARTRTTYCIALAAVVINTFASPYVCGPPGNRVVQDFVLLVKENTFLLKAASRTISDEPNKDMIAAAMLLTGMKESAWTISKRGQKQEVRRTRLCMKGPALKE